jgi:hypothetical protein
MTVGSLYVAYRDEQNSDVNELFVEQDVLPSPNRAPEVTILTPSSDTLLLRPAKRRTDFTITIRASDPDGTIDRVIVHDPTYSPAPSGVDENGYIFTYLGKNYGARELDDYLKSNPPEERLARRTGKDTFTYTLTDPPYGVALLGVEAHDADGRSSFTSAYFRVESDAEIEIVSPKPNEIFPPGSTVNIEIVSRLKEGPLKQIMFVDRVDGPGRPFQLVSRDRGVYRHRYKWVTDPGSPAQESFRVMITEESGALRLSESIGFLVRTRPSISVTSPRNADEFSIHDTVRIAFNVTGRQPDEEYSIRVDGKEKGLLSSGSEFIWRDLGPGIHTVEVVARLRDIELARSQPITIRVK